MTDVELYERLRYEHCPLDIMLLWKQCGETAIKAILAGAPGVRIHIPKKTAFPGLLGEIIPDLSKSKTANEICIELGISLSTVNRYLKHKIWR